MALKTPNNGPLAGIRVVEFAGIGPGPMCGMLLADMGAEVLLLERTAAADVGLPRPRSAELVHRGKQSIAVDLKHADGLSLAADLVARADVLLEGFRPGAMERLGLGPDACLERNPRLVYARMTGYGQHGPLSTVAGHDMNYISLTGALHAIGRDGQAPVPPLNLVGDYAGGSMTLAFGIACALNERHASGCGQVIDAAMVEGAALLMTPFFGLHAAGMHDGPRGTNLLDGGAPFYDVYACADGKYLAFAAIERKFRQVFVQRSGMTGELLMQGDDRATWPALRLQLTALFASRTQAQWCALLEDVDACVTPVLDTQEAPAHRHSAARQSFVSVAGVVQPAPAPRYSRTPAGIANPPPETGQGGAARAAGWGIEPGRLARLAAANIIITNTPPEPSA